MGKRTPSHKQRLAYRRITFDVDGVLAMSAVSVIEAINHKYQTTYSLDQMNRWEFLETDLQKRLGISKEESYDIWLLPGVMLNAPPISDAIEIVHDLSKMGAQITFITSRSGILREDTLSWFGKYLPFVTPDQLLTQPGHERQGTKFKVETLRRLHPDLHIDDSMELVPMLDGLKVVLVPQPWNQDAPEHLRKTWPEIHRMIVNGQ